LEPVERRLAGDSRVYYRIDPRGGIERNATKLSMLTVVVIVVFFTADGATYSEALFIS
jgi:hypothetical protein